MVCSSTTPMDNGAEPGQEKQEKLTRPAQDTSAAAGVPADQAVGLAETLQGAVLGAEGGVMG